MDSPVATKKLHQSLSRNKTMEKKDDTSLHIAVRAGDLDAAFKILSSYDEQKLDELLSKTNQSGETALYVAAEYGCVDLVREMIKHYDSEAASIKAKNGFDAFHIAAKQGNIEVLKILMEMHSELSMTFDQNNSTALHTASEQGHIEVVNYLLENNSSMASIARSNLKTALHSCARKGHLEVVKVLSQKVPAIVGRADKKGQTALHMAVKGQNVEVVNALIAADNGLINMVDKKDNTALHITTRKGRTQIVLALLNNKGTINKEVINKYGETALDTAERFGQSEIALILQEHGVPKAKSMKNIPPPLTPKTRELKKTVSDIKHGVHNQLKHVLKTEKNVKGMRKRINKMHLEGLNNAINSTTIVAVLIATVTFAAIFQLPGQYVDNPKKIPKGFSLGEANIASKPEFIIFLIFDALALFISLAVVVVQTSIVIVEKRAKKQVMQYINKFMWLACVFVSVAFLALSFIVVGNDKWLAVGVTFAGDDDEMVQISAELDLAKDAFLQITSRLRANLFDREGMMSTFVPVLPCIPPEVPDVPKYDHRDSKGHGRGHSYSTELPANDGYGSYGGVQARLSGDPYGAYGNYSSGRSGSSGGSRHNPSSRRRDYNY